MTTVPLSHYHYVRFLRTVAVPVLSNSTTFDTDLQKFGTRLFRQRFHGVYMIDEIPSTFDATRPYGIINLDRAPGTHWIAVAFHRSLGLLVYDSFGRMNETPKELTRLYGQSVVTDPDAEQTVDEKNCGARCFAWLCVMDVYGVREAICI